ncbi:MAG: putative zinc ribbon domain protein [candidate division BRC1 bacterium ADurb.BinA364]|nr:MAG: putative zinc ribbon domain protein [candidate division BRC1 bacterium ADurb.BinA364]
MNENGKRLLETQNIDARIVEIETQLARYPKRLKSLADASAQAQGRLAAAKNRLRETRAERSLLETEIAAKEAEIQKFEAQRMRVKTNKEYQAIDHQIETLRAWIGERETAGLELLDKEEAMEAKIKELQSLASHAQAEEAEEQERIGALEKEKREALERLKAERKRWLALVEEDDVERYLNLYARYPGDAIAATDGRTCGGCHMTVLASIVQEIKESGRLAPCSHCHRLLYLRD